jgi:aldehyde dehydrogenase (NAD+)
MVSFTGSNAAGIAVAKNAADTIKRVAQELGGKSPYILCEDSLFETSVPAAIKRCFINSGQTCTAPTRLLVPQGLLARIEDIAAQCVAGIETGNGQPGSLGPLVSKTQFERVQGYITMGLDEGARLIAGGPGRVDGLARGYSVRPTIFSGVANTMAVAREEIFGPVLCIMPYRDEAHAVVLANDSVFGLAAYVSSADLDNARRIAEQLEAGVVHINEPERDIEAPFGGYKQSGNGREWGRWGLREFLETKAMIGWGADS